jgi:probable HAF family extracellular repeat protein
MVGLGDLPGGDAQSYAFDVSPDGSVVVGTGSGPDGYEAFRWTQQTGMVGLGDLPGGYFNSASYATSADGQVIVGFANFNSDPGVYDADAFIWTPQKGMRYLKDALLADYGIKGVDGWKLVTALSITPDGSMVVGEGLNPDGHWEAFLAVLAPATATACWTCSTSCAL